MAYRLTAVLLFLAGSLLGQVVHNPRQVFRVEADGRELSLRSNATGVESDKNQLRFLLGDHLQVTLINHFDQDGLRIQATLRNTGPAPIRLNRVILSERTDRALADAHFLAMSGWQIAV